MKTIATTGCYLCLTALLLCAGTAYSGNEPSYRDPLPLNNYVNDVNAMLNRAFAHNHWRLSPPRDGGYYQGHISYKGFEIHVLVSVADGDLLLTLDHVYATDCNSNCRDLGEQPVVSWLVNLRRSIAYELTFMVRDKLAQQASA